MRFLQALLASHFAVCTALAGELVIAQVGPFSGPLSINGIANYDGTKSCVEETNAEGGINGNRLKLVREDDQYKPDETIRLLREVARRDKPIAFINLLGSANVSAVLKDQTLDNLKIPVVGVTPGADILRNSENPWLFHLHASDNAQLRRIMSHLSTLGIQRVAVVYQDIPFGQGGMKFIDEIAQSLNVSVVGRVPVPSAADDLTAQATLLRTSNAQAYVMILAPNSGTSLARDVRAGKDTTPIYGMSYVPVKGIIDKTGGANAAGIGLAQVTPNTFSASSGLVRRFRAVMGKHMPALKEHTQLHLIGYLSCRVLVEGLRQSGKTPTPESLQTSLRKVRVDFGGYMVDFAGTNVASKFVDIGVITNDGRLMY